MRSENSPEILQRQYDARFSGSESYRNLVWKELCNFFTQYIPAGASILDLGCGWGEFINNIAATKKIGMDLNPDGQKHLQPEITFLHADCADKWPLAQDSLDIVFTSNFLEHLPAKKAVVRAVSEAYRCLRPGGKIICMGPNIKYIHGAYWDFWDHNLQLTELSVAELMQLNGFCVAVSISRFLPYTMSTGRKPPLFFVKLYLNWPLLWRFFGKQFLVIGVKPENQRT